MLFPRTDRWRCQLQRHHIQLYQGNRLQEQQGWQPDMPLAEQLDHMLSPLHCRLPWQNSIGFELDTPHISYLLTPWSQGIVTPAELRQYARKLLAEQHGTAVGGRQRVIIQFWNSHQFISLSLLLRFKALAQAFFVHFANRCQRWLSI